VDRNRSARTAHHPLSRDSIRRTANDFQARVTAQLRTKTGQPYSEALAEQDIRALYATGAVQNVKDFRRATGRRRKGHGSFLQTRSLVNEIEITGAERISVEKKKSCARRSP